MTLPSNRAVAIVFLVISATSFALALAIGGFGEQLLAAFCLVLSGQAYAVEEIQNV